MNEDIYDEPPEVWVRCILCGEEFERSEFDFHECEIEPFEVVS